jgi:hypothetical protein
MPKFERAPKLSLEEEEALLKKLRAERELKAKGLLQAEAQAVARKLGGVAIEKVPEEAAPLVAKDKKNFGVGDTSGAVIAITLNAVLLSASVSEEDTAGGKGGKKAGGKAGAKKNAKPKIGAKVERLPPPTGEAATEAIKSHKATLARVSQTKDVKKGQQSLLLALESFLCNEYNEPLLPATPQLLTALSDENLLDREMLAEYWAKVKTTREAHTVDLQAAKKEHEEAGLELTVATEGLKKGQKEEAESIQQLKWTAAEVLNARTGNQPSPEEVAREKAASVADTKARDDRLQKQKNSELHQKRQVSALNANEAAIKNVAEKVSQARTCELMHEYGQPFFDASAASNSGYPGKEAKAEDPAEAKNED